jgi:hypothetical protein
MRTGFNTLNRTVTVMQACKHTGRQVAVGTEFCTVAPQYELQALRILRWLLSMELQALRILRWLLDF